MIKENFGEMSFRRRSRHVGDNAVIGGAENLLKSNVANDLVLKMMRNIHYEIKYINKQTDMTGLKLM